MENEATYDHGPEFGTTRVVERDPLLSTSAMKLDGEKVRYELVPPEALHGMAEVLTFGAKKYADRNWEKGLAYSRVFGALQRHMWAWFGGQDLDPETGLSHLHHASCCIAFLQTYVTRGTGTDDRPE